MNLNGSKFSWKLKCPCFNKISCLSQHVIRYCYIVRWWGIKSNKKELTPVTTFYPHQDVLHILYFRQGLHWKCFAWKIILLSRIVTILGIYFYILSHFCSRINNHIRYNSHNSTFLVSLEFESRYSRLIIIVIYHINQQLLASRFVSRKIQLLSMLKNCQFLHIIFPDFLFK